MGHTDDPSGTNPGSLQPWEHREDRVAPSSANPGGTWGFAGAVGRFWLSAALWGCAVGLEAAGMLLELLNESMLHFLAIVCSSAPAAPAAKEGEQFVSLWGEEKPPSRAVPPDKALVTG